MTYKLAPSLLAADFAYLEKQVKEAESAGADWLHLDIMDGQFVPNISFGPMVVEALRPVTALVFDVHLMIENPENYIEPFAQAGAQGITVHIEASPHLHRTIQQIKDMGLKAGVALNPATPISHLADIVSDVDLILIMSVNPGFGGQRYIPHSTTKIARLRQWLNEIDSQAEVEVDGGIDASTAAEVVKAGATVLVAGSAIFNKRATVANSIQTLRAVI